MRIVEIQSNVKAWKVKYVYVTSDEWDFGNEGTEAHRRSPPSGAEQGQEYHQSALSSSGASEQARPPTNEPGEGKAHVEVNPTCPTAFPDPTTQPSSATPTPPQKINVSRSILDSINQTPDTRIAVAYVWVDEGLYPRDQDILLATDPRRLRGAMMVNVIEQAEDFQTKEKEWKSLEERFKEMEKKRDEREKEYQQRMIELKEASA
ncbi:hypothetical protein Dimus_003103 [Dionaea muscipula]